MTARHSQFTAYFMSSVMARGGLLLELPIVLVARLGGMALAAAGSPQRVANGSRGRRRGGGGRQRVGPLWAPDTPGRDGRFNEHDGAPAAPADSGRLCAWLHRHQHWDALVQFTGGAMRQLRVSYMPSQINLEAQFSPKATRAPITMFR